jgi:DNA-directed RNA polymerase subunit M/transcription elongation factor TFIIS
MPNQQSIRTILLPRILFAITPLIQKEQCTDIQIKKWCSKTASLLGLYSNLSLAKFELEEILHYFKSSDINTLTIGTERDAELVLSMFTENIPEQECFHLQKPEETFQEIVESDACTKCKSTDTMTLARQTRSADEPTSYYSECYTCKHKWRSG